jgi:hypothetical protein
MKIFWTSIFWLVVFFLAIFYLKTFDATIGAKFATWISPTAIVTTGDMLSGAQDPVLSGLTTLQTSVDTMQSKIEDIANKLGITAIVTTGVETSVIT